MKKVHRGFIATAGASLMLASLLVLGGCSGEMVEDLARQAGQAVYDEVDRAFEEELGLGLDELGQIAGVGLGAGSGEAQDEGGRSGGGADAAGAAGGEVSEGLRHAVSTELVEATVERVVDGDTLKVVLAGSGESQRVRLIGINTPESVAPEEERNTSEGASASDFLKAHLDEGQTVWLMFDTEKYDQYDRMLAYVWTQVPNDFTDPAEVRTKMVNGYMAYQGYAVVHAYEPNDAYCDMLHDLADDAEWEGRGLWEISSTWADGI